MFRTGDFQLKLTVRVPSKAVGMVGRCNCKIGRQLPDGCLVDWCCSPWLVGGGGDAL